MRFVTALVWALVMLGGAQLSPLLAQQPQPKAAATPATASPDDTARWLAGLAPKPGSALTALSSEAQ
jgi:hypothetical protein